MIKHLVVFLVDPVDLIHEIRMSAKRLIDGGLVFMDVPDEPAVAGGHADVGTQTKTTVFLRAAERAVQVPDRTRVQLVLVCRPVAVHEVAAGRDIYI